MSRQRKNSLEYLNPWSSGSKWKGRGQQFGMVNPASASNNGRRTRRASDLPVRGGKIRHKRAPLTNLNSLQLASLFGSFVALALIVYIIVNFF